MGANLEGPASRFSLGREKGEAEGATNFTFYFFRTQFSILQKENTLC